MVGLTAFVEWNARDRYRSCVHGAFVGMRREEETEREKRKKERGWIKACITNAIEPRDARIRIHSFLTLWTEGGEVFKSQETRGTTTDVKVSFRATYYGQLIFERRRN